MEHRSNRAESRARPVFTISAERRRDGVVLLAFFILALVLTYPLILQFGTHVAGDGSDDPALAWNLWWVRYAIFDLGRSPIYTNYLFYPVGLNLAFYTLTYLNAFVSIPIQFAFGLIPAANVNLIISFTLSGFGTYLLVKYLLRRESGLQPQPNSRNLVTLNEVKGLSLTFAAFAAGLLYAFSSNKFLYASLGQFNIASSQWIPFYFLFLIKCFPVPPHAENGTLSHAQAGSPPRSGTPSLLHSFLLGLFLLFQALSEFIFASFLIIFTAAYLVYWLVAAYRHKTEDGTRKTEDILQPPTFNLRHYAFAIMHLAFGLLTFLLPMLPILAAMVSDMLTEGDFIQSGLGFSNVFSADLLGFFVPSHLHPMFGALESRFHFPYINFAYLGYVALALALVALLRVRRARIWGIWSALVLLLTLGPTLRVNGTEFDLPFLPFNALLEIPFVKGNRYPSRWSVLLTLCLAVLAGYGLAWLIRKVERWQVTRSRSFNPQTTNLQPANLQHPIFRLHPSTFLLLPSVLCFLLLFEHLSVPLPTSDLRVPDVYAAIGREPGNFTVLELPLAWRNGFRVTGSYRADSQAPIDRGFMLAQWYQGTLHHPILNGNTSRNPELKFQYFAETPVLDSLIAIQEGHSIDDATRARVKALAPRLLQFFNIRYVIWHKPYQNENREVADRTRAFVEDAFPITKTSESYENGQGTVVYRVNDLPPLWNAYLVSGNDPLARLFFAEGWGPVGENTMWVTRQQARMFMPLSKVQDTRITFTALAPVDSADNGIKISVNGIVLGHYQPIPVVDGTFAIEVPASMLQVGLNELILEFDKIIPYAGLNRPPLSVVVRSAGEEQGDFGHIYVDGVDESPNARGYNFVLINPKTAAIDARASFDTFSSEQESARMANFISQIPQGELVAVAVRDEASQHLTPAAAERLKSLGAKQDLVGKFRWSHALLITKGNPEGAREAASETKVSQVFNAALIAEQNIAASVGEIRVEPQ